MRKKCGTCDYWVSPRDAGTIGECHRAPPQVISDGFTVWPRTDTLTDWCGEHAHASGCTLEVAPKPKREPAVRKKKAAAADK